MRFTCSKNKKLTKRRSKGQTGPTKNLADFEHFNCSQWLDMRNKAWTGEKYFIPIFLLYMMKLKKSS